MNTLNEPKYLTELKEDIAFIKQCNMTIDKARIKLAKERPNISVILKHNLTNDIIITTCSENDIHRIQSLIDTINDDNIDKDTKKEAKEYCQGMYNFKLEDIIAFGKLEKELTKSKLESFIDVRVVPDDKFENKNITRKAYKCFANEEHHLNCTCNLILHEDAGSSFNCLISTKLKSYQYGIIYKQYKS